MTNLNIFLENNDRAVYFAGQVLKGTIELHLNEPKKVTGLYFIVSGIAKCNWSQVERRTYGRGTDRRTENHTVYFEGKDVYLNVKTYLFGICGASSVEIAAGTHRYSFECQLPLTLPASFEASRGHIRYNVEACLDIPWRFDKETKLQFTVARKDDLNERPELMIPCRNEQIKRFCGFCCRSAPLIATVTIPCGGFTPGQTIPITIQYKNMSDTQVTGTKINLKRVIKFNSYTPRPNTKWEVEKIVEVHREGVGAKTSNTIEVNFDLPRILVNSNNRYCNVVQLSYDLKVEVKVSGCHRNFEMVFPIVIGSVPISFNQTNNNVPLQMPMQIPYTDFTNGTMPSAPMPYNDFTKPMPEQPPPSFEEVVKMNPEKDDSGNFNQPKSVLGWSVTAQPPSAPSAPSAPSDEK